MHWKLRKLRFYKQICYKRSVVRKVKTQLDTFTSFYYKKPICKSRAKASQFFQNYRLKSFFTVY